MSKFLRICTCFALVLSTLFVWIGYAALTDELTIEGQLAFVLPDWNEVVITDVRDANGEKVLWIQPTTVDSTVNLAVGESVTYTIKVKNYSDKIKYQYSGIVKDDSVAYNALLDNGITVMTDFPNDTDVEPGEEITFTATYTVTSAAYANIDIRTLLNYKFGVHVDSVGDLAVDNALKQYEKILNTPADYAALVEEMGNNSSASGNYIGNVAGEDKSEDTSFVEKLFDGNLTLNENGVNKYVTCLIKSENVNGKPSMTLYLTPDEVKGSGTVTVYAAVFYQENGAWTSAGDLYKGTANKNNYDASLFGERNSFNTDTWCTSEQEYKVCDSSSYTVGEDTYNVNAYSYLIEAGRRNWVGVQEGGIDDVMAEVARADAGSVLRQMCNVAEAIINSGIYSSSSEAIIALDEIYTKADTMCDANGTPASGVTQAEITSLMKEFSHILKSFAD